MDEPSCFQAYLNYDRDNPPKAPDSGDEWTRFICISDTHSKTPDLPLGDVLLHAGDLSRWGYPNQLEDMARWLQALPHPIKIVIGGNHDMVLDPSITVIGQDPVEDGLHRDAVARVRAMFKGEDMRRAGVHYLENEAFSFTTARGKVWKVYGSPASPQRPHGVFGYSGPEEGAEIFNRIPLDTEILLTHTPPRGTLDLTKKGKHAGCKALAKRLSALDACKLHVFGHIHEAFGAEPIKEGGKERLAVNAAIVHPGTRPVIVDMMSVV